MWLKDRLSARARLRLRVLWQDLKAAPWGRHLGELAVIYGTDKGHGHSYCEHYQRYFSAFKYRKLNLLEIGVGGYENPQSGGGSLRMWRRYFPRGKIYGIDVHDKQCHGERRITIFQGDQASEAFLQQVVDASGGLDIIVDDGSHRNADVIKSFEVLFPLMNVGGIYVIEDTQTSYWDVCGGSSTDLNKSGTMMNYFKQRADGLNYREFDRPSYQSTYFDRNIASLHFYHNMIFVCKGDNTQESNVLVGNRLPIAEQARDS